MGDSLVFHDIPCDAPASSPPSAGKLRFKLPRRRLSRAFLQWFSGVQSQFRIPLRIVRVGGNGHVWLDIAGFGGCLSAVLHDRGISVVASWQGEVVDLLWEQEAVVRWEGGRYSCALCKRGDAELYPSREALWRAHLFAEFLDMVNSVLARTEVLRLTIADGFSSAEPLGRDGQPVRRHIATTVSHMDSVPPEESRADDAASSKQARSLVFVDAEFTSLSDSRLLSIGAVTDRGGEFYAVVDGVSPTICTRFVREYVLPVLEWHAPHVRGSHGEVARAFTRWLEGTCGGPDNCVLVVDDECDQMLLQGLQDTAHGRGGARPECLVLPLAGSDMARTCFDAWFEAIAMRCRHNALDDARAYRHAALLFLPPMPDSGAG